MKNKGFTLIELLVVIAIIGILSGIVLTSLNSARDKANQAAAQATMSGVAPAAIICLDDDSALLFPDDAEDGGGEICSATTSVWPSLPTGWKYTATGNWDLVVSDGNFEYEATSGVDGLTPGDIVVRCNETGCSTATIPTP